MDDQRSIDQRNQSRLTDQQRRAIETRDVSVALSAGAGCGKTFVLTERFLSHLDPAFSGNGSPCQWHEIIAITFTERAAREMRDRIRRRCQERLIGAPADEAQVWWKLVRDMDGARISTIHSYCTALLRAHAVEAGLDPRFTVLDQTASIAILSGVIDDQLRELLSKRDGVVLDLLVEFGLDGLRDRIRLLIDHRGKAGFADWQDIEPASLAKKWHHVCDTEVLPLAPASIAADANTQRLVALLEAHPSSQPACREGRQELLDRLTRLPDSQNPREDLDALHELAKVKNFGGPKSWDQPAIYDQVKQACKALRAAIKGWLNALKFDPASEARAAELTLDVYRLAWRITEAYERRKRELAALDFEDLVVQARDLLVDPRNAGLRARVASQIRLLLVDEFQDTDGVQLDLVEALCGDGLTTGKLFFVGDFKQSIYRFRGAEPQVFHLLRDKIPSAGRLPLTKNFRSQPAILDFVNALFYDSLGGQYERLVASRSQVAPRPAIEFLWAADEDKTRVSVDEQRQREADWVARRLRAMLDAGESLVWDDQAAQSGSPRSRPVRLGDIAILFRALSSVQHYEEALRRYGISYYLVGGHAFYAQQEIFDLLNLLRCVDSLADEVSLLGALRSPMFSLSDETLFWLARHSDGLSAGLLASRLPAELEESQRHRARFAAQTLNELRRMKDRVSMTELIQYALDRTGYPATQLAEFLGERKLANLEKLIDMARDFDRAGLFTLADFIAELSRFVAEQPKEALAATEAESSDVVRLMTIHQAKGLEFPVVVVADVEQTMALGSCAATYDTQLGPVVHIPNNPWEKWGATGHDLWKLIQRAADRDEQKRLLYVATTRAADFLILSAGVTDINKPKGPWRALLGQRFDLETGNLRTPLPAGYRDPQIRVIRERPELAADEVRADHRRSLGKILQSVADAAGRTGAVPKSIQPIPADRGGRRQFSFSRLTGHLHAPREREAGAEIELPQKKNAAHNALALGTLVHEVLADLPFAPATDLDALVYNRAASQTESETCIAEATRLVRSFLDSARAARLRQAQKVHVELEFLLAWPPGSTTEGGAYLQGYIDCLYQDQEGWHLLDYKTNRITPETIASVAAPYEMQMLVYALAIQQSLGEPPVEIVLHFLRGNLERRFELTADARRRLIEQVNRAILAETSTSVM